MSGAVAGFEYDGAGRPTARMRPDGVRETYAWDARGNLGAPAQIIIRVP